MYEYAEIWQNMPTVYKKTLNCIGNNSWMSSPGVTFTLTCDKGVTELQNLTNLRSSSFAESHQMRQKNFDFSPNPNPSSSYLLSSSMPLPNTYPWTFNLLASPAQTRKLALTLFFSLSRMAFSMTGVCLAPMNIACFALLKLSDQ